MAGKQTPAAPEDLEKRRKLLFEALAKESDRGVVLVGACFLDEALEALLRAAFRFGGAKPSAVIDPLFDAFGPLASFSAKIKLSFALNLIDGYVFRDLETMRKLRNIFAHSVEAAKFDSREVVTLTETLEAPELWAKARSRKSTEADSKCGAVPEKPHQSRDNMEAAIERLRVSVAVSWIGAIIHFFIENADTILHHRMGARPPAEESSDN